MSNLELNKSTPVLASPKRAPTPQPPTESSGDKFRRVGAGIGSALSAKRAAQEPATDDAQPTVLDEVSEGVGATIMKFVGILKNKVRRSAGAAAAKVFTCCVIDSVRVARLSDSGCRASSAE